MAYNNMGGAGLVPYLLKSRAESNTVCAQKDEAEKYPQPLFTADQVVELIERRIEDLQKEDDSVNEMLGNAMSEEDHEKMDALCKEHNRLMTKVTTLKRLRSEFTQNGDSQ